MNLDFKGYDAIVRDEETEDTLLMGKVVAFDKETNLIELNVQNTIDLSQRKMQVLLFSDGLAYSYHGTFRKLLTQNQIGIALYKGGVKVDRKNERFAVDLKAEIVEHKQEDGTVIEDEHTGIYILDISRSGIRIEGSELLLSDQDRIAVAFKVKNQEKIFCESSSCWKKE